MHILNSDDANVSLSLNNVNGSNQWTRPHLFLYQTVSRQKQQQKDKCEEGMKKNLKRKKDSKKKKRNEWKMFMIRSKLEELKLRFIAWVQGWVHDRLNHKSPDL